MKLLISVVNEEEVGPAIRGGADIIDVKNPREGALGANFPRVIRDVRKHTPSGLPVSATIGDSPNKPGSASLAALGAAVCGIQYVKVGLLGTREVRETVFLLSEVCEAVKEYEAGINVIAAAYADANNIGALPPLELQNVATESGVDGCILDTFSKGGSSLFSYLGDDDLRGFVEHCRHKGLLSALAGSLGQNDIRRVAQIGPDIIGFRTAACLGDRVNGTVDFKQVAHLKNLIADSKSPL